MKKYLGIAGLAAGAALMLAATPALARVDLSVNIGVPGVYVHGGPAPVYVHSAPAPVYVRPAPVYVQPQPVYVQPQPVYVGHHHHYRGHRMHGRRDRDRDGVPDRYDSRPRNPYRY